MSVADIQTIPLIVIIGVNIISMVILITHSSSTVFIWFRSVVVITSALHAEGPGFEPQRNQRCIECLFRIFFCSWKLSLDFRDCTFTFLVGHSILSD